MKARLPVAVLGIVLAALAGALALTLSAPTLAVLVSALIGLVVGLVLGQALMWLRSSAGRAARIEHHVQHRLEGMRVVAEKRHEIVHRLMRETRERATSAEREAKRAADVLPKVQESVKAQRSELRSDLRETRLSIIDRVDDQVVLLEDYMQLLRLVPMSLPMPRPGRWAASEDLLLWLAGFVLEQRPPTVVDLGSGQSSVWMAAAMRTAGYDGRVIGVDHDEHYAQATRELAARQGVDRWLTVVHAPLAEEEIAGRSVRWYDVDALGDLRDIDLLCIDGPPGQGTSHARWAALPALHDRLSPRSAVVLDDLIRRDEQEILDDWLERYPEFAIERIDFEKGAAVMRRGT